MISFDRFGTEENETIHSLKQGIEKGDIKLHDTVRTNAKICN